MYFDDNNPPHFYVLGRNGDAQVRIDTLEVIASRGTVDLREALNWAAINKTVLETRWLTYSGGAS